MIHSKEASNVNIGDFIMCQWKKIFYEDIPIEEKNKKWKNYIEEQSKVGIINVSMSSDYIKKHKF